MRLKVGKKPLVFIKYLIFKHTPLILKYFLRNAANKGIQYIFTCKHVNRMSEASLFIVNVEQYINCVPEEKDPLKHVYFLCT